MRCHPLALLVAALVGLPALCRAEVRTTVDRVPGDGATAAYRFGSVPPPAGDDLASAAKFSIDGERDGNGGTLDVLHDGKAASNQDDPAGSFFFEAGTAGGRIRIDLGAARAVGQINTYSWHTDSRAPQVYKVYVADGQRAGFDADPKPTADPSKAGWTLLASVDTRPEGDGGQVGVSLANADKSPLGTFRYLLLAVSRTESRDPFGNTFFGEIDVVAPDQVRAAAPLLATEPGEKYRIVIDTAGLSPEMVVWAGERLMPVCRQWYPRIVEMLPSDGYTAPQTITVVFDKDMDPPAAASGNRVMCKTPWFEQNKDGEAIGAVVHEMVHVVQQYRFGRRNVPNWLQEGIPDYIRWFLYEPEKDGARIRNVARVKYNQSYRVSGNFLDWATRTYDKDLVRKLNAALRDRKYTDEIWKDLAGGKTLDELDKLWKESLAKR